MKSINQPPKIEDWPDHSYSVGRIYNPNYIPIYLGKYTSIGEGLRVITNIHAPDLISNYPFAEMLKWKDYPRCQRRYPVYIGNDVWIGANVAIVDKVTVGDGALIGAYTVIAKDIPPYAIAVGNPPFIIGYRFGHNQIRSLLKIKWWDWTDKEMEERKADFQLDINKFIEKYG